MNEQRQPMDVHLAADYAYISGARQLALSSEGAGWRGLTGHLFHYMQQRASPISVPPALDNVLTIHVSGSTKLEGKLGRGFACHHAAPGDIFVIPRGEPTQWSWTSACSIFCLYVDPALLACVAAEDGALNPALIELIPAINERDPLLYQLGAALLSELRSSGPASSLYVESLTQALAVHLLRRHAALDPRVPEPADSPDSKVVRRALEHINDHLARDLSLAEIALAAGVSPYHLARQFKRATGRTVHQYVVGQRLEAARRMLAAGKRSIAEIAALTGFADQSHLHRHFKATYGITPGEAIDQSTNLQRERKNVQDEPRHPE